MMINTWKPSAALRTNSWRQFAQKKKKRLSADTKPSAMEEASIHIYFHLFVVFTYSSTSWRRKSKTLLCVEVQVARFVRPLMMEWNPQADTCWLLRGPGGEELITINQVLLLHFCFVPISTNVSGWRNRDTFVLLWNVLCLFRSVVLQWNGKKMQMVSFVQHLLKTTWSFPLNEALTSSITGHDWKNVDMKLKPL